MYWEGLCHSWSWLARKGSPHFFVFHMNLCLFEGQTIKKKSTLILGFTRFCIVSVGMHNELYLACE